MSRQLLRPEFALARCTSPLARLGAIALVAALTAPMPGQAGVTDTVHNLSASGPGRVRTGSTDRVCVFCHTPHNASPQRALWNRELPGEAYKLYDSSTLVATLQQPTGASRLCLSCHDGTLALSNLRVPPPGGAGALGPLTGDASLGTDLSDDHPVSFVYDSALAMRRGELRDPAALLGDVPLDAARQLQCTTCHDPHDNPYRVFLRVDDRRGGLCVRCHQLPEWPSSTHATSPATWRGTGTNPWPGSPYETVADNACRSCHRPHTAGHPERLFTQDEEPAVCLVCHDGSLATLDIKREVETKFSAHPVQLSSWTHEPRENPYTMPVHVTCADCHDPHTVSSGRATPPAVSGRLRGVTGLTSSGGRVTEARYEYEVCRKCPGARPSTNRKRIRQDDHLSIGARINPSNVSYHPVAAVGANPGARGFEPGYNAASVIYCTDCHNNDDAATGGTAPRGPHASRYEPILERLYLMDDGTPESPGSYALCYKCHNRSYLLSDTANGFSHRGHVVRGRAPCAVCHDAHGSRTSRGLINFVLMDRGGLPVVRPSVRGRLEHVSLGAGQGECSLLCHGKDHDRLPYPSR
jgi:predicted CXXCH cytochrome family protein